MILPLILVILGAIPCAASAMTMAGPGAAGSPVTWPAAVIQVFNGAERSQLTELIADLNSPTLSNLARLDLAKTENYGPMESLFEDLDLPPQRAAALTPQALLAAGQLKSRLFILSETLRPAEERANESAGALLNDLHSGRLTPRRARFALPQARSLLENERLRLSPENQDRLREAVPDLERLAKKANFLRDAPLKVYHLTRDDLIDEKKGIVFDPSNVVPPSGITALDLSELTRGGWRDSPLMRWYLNSHVKSGLEGGSDLVMVEIDLRPEDHREILVKEYRDSNDGELTGMDGKLTSMKVVTLDEFRSNPDPPAVYEFILRKPIPLTRVTLVSRTPASAFPGSYHERYKWQEATTEDVDAAMPLLFPAHFWKQQAEGGPNSPVPRLWQRPIEWEENLRDRVSSRLSKAALRVFSAYLAAGDYPSARAFLETHEEGGRFAGLFWRKESVDPILPEFSRFPPSPQARKIAGLRDIFLSLAEGDAARAREQIGTLREALASSWDLDFRTKGLLDAINSRGTREIKKSLMDFFEYFVGLNFYERLNFHGILNTYYAWLIFDSMSGMGGGAFDRGLARIRDQFWRDIERWRIYEKRNDRTNARHANYQQFKGSDPF